MQGFYQNYSNTPNYSGFNQPNILAPQQIIQVQGKASVDTIQMAPNSSVLLLDNTAPIVWMCVSDGVGRVNATPYDICVHEDKPPVDVNSLEERIHKLELILTEMENKNAKSNVTKSNTKQNEPKSRSN